MHQMQGGIQHRAMRFLQAKEVVQDDIGSDLPESARKKEMAHDS